MEEKDKIKIWAISDTHCDHHRLIPPNPEEVDMVIHSGDAGGHRDLSINDGQMRSFLEWFNKLPYKHKVYVPGNHDTSVEAKFHNFKQDYPNITVLIHESITLEGVNIFGSPYTPTFGHGWAYNVPRHKISNYWEDIPLNTDIIVTHGPPKGILDYTIAHSNYYEKVGDKALLNKVTEINPKYHIFGHLHDEGGVYNCGIFKPNQSGLKTEFVNACVKNLKYVNVNNGIYLEYDKGKQESAI